MTNDEVAKQNFEDAGRAPADAWAVVIYFYAAVHAVNYDAHGKKDAPKEWQHRKRTEHVTYSKKLCKVEQAYRALGNLAHDARYRPSKLPMNATHTAKARDLARAVLECAGLAPNGAAAP